VHLRSIAFNQDPAWRTDDFVNRQLQAGEIAWSLSKKRESFSIP
jgi:hypothetical protein